MTITLDHLAYQGVFGVVLGNKIAGGSAEPGDLKPAEANASGITIELDSGQATRVVLALTQYLDLCGFVIPDHPNWGPTWFKENAKDPAIRGALKVMWQLSDQGFKFKPENL